MGVWGFSSEGLCSPSWSCGLKCAAGPVRGQVCSRSSSMPAGSPEPRGRPVLSGSFCGLCGCNPDGLVGSRKVPACRWGEAGVGRGAWPPMAEICPQQPRSSPPPALLPHAQKGVWQPSPARPIRSGPDLFTRALGECKQFILSDFISLKALSVNTNGY